MTTLVIATPRGELEDAFMRQLWPSPVATIAGDARVYRLFNIADGQMMPPRVFCDPIDGAVLLESRTFHTMDAARAWITADAAQHASGGRAS